MRVVLVMGNRSSSCLSTLSSKNSSLPQVIDLRPPFAKGMTSEEAGAHLKTLPYKVGINICIYCI